MRERGTVREGQRERGTVRERGTDREREGIEDMGGTDMNSKSDSDIQRSSITIQSEKRTNRSHLS